MSWVLVFVSLSKFDPDFEPRWFDSYAECRAAADLYNDMAISAHSGNRVTCIPEYET